jgi:metal-responsive CopG/Arc/MetJ family transcriptional regulator
VPTQLVLIQTRISARQAKKLDKLQKKAGFVTRAEFLRQIVAEFLETKVSEKSNV